MLIRTAGGPASLIHRRLVAVQPRCRYYSIPTTNTPRTGKQNEPLPHPAKKPKLDLRPAPIKPTTTTTTAAAAASASKPPPPPSTTTSNAHAAATPHLPALPSFGAAKEEAKHDIADAQAHGILAPPPAGASWIKRTLHQIIQIAKFYYHGTKLIFTRRKAIALIHARVAAGGAPLTRAEFRLIATQKDDIKKLVPFLIIALLLEEVIPLIAIYAPFMLPSTCILPAQQARIEAKRAEKARAFAALHSAVYAQLAAKSVDAHGHLPFAALSEPDAPTAVCGALGLSTLGPDVLRIRRIRKHLEFIMNDDAMLLKDDAALSRRALVEALEERGIRTAPETGYRELQKHLLAWLAAVRVVPFPTEEALTRRLALAIPAHRDLRSH